MTTPTRIAVVVFSGLALVANAGVAPPQSSFTIDPLLILLNAQAQSAVVSVTNPTNKNLRFEIKAFAWDQSTASNVMDLTPTTDILIFPPLMTVKPGMTQRVRVGTTAAFGPTEKAYRLTIEELPGGVVPTEGAQVGVRTRVGIPLFLEATEPSLAANIGAVIVKNRIVSITLNNTGHSHLMVDTVMLRGMSAPEEMVFEDAIPGWYVLAGKSRMWTYTLNEAQCRKSKFLDIELFAQSGSVSVTKVAVPVGACRP